MAKNNLFAFALLGVGAYFLLNKNNSAGFISEGGGSGSPSFIVPQNTDSGSSLPQIPIINFSESPISLPTIPSGFGTNERSSKKPASTFIEASPVQADTILKFDSEVSNLKKTQTSMGVPQAEINSGFYQFPAPTRSTSTSIMPRVPAGTNGLIVNQNLLTNPATSGVQKKEALRSSPVFDNLFPSNPFSKLF